MLKILQVGEFLFDYYDHPLFSSFNDCVNISSVDKFEVAPYFSGYEYGSIFEKISKTMQNRYKLGPVINRINRDLLIEIEKNSYDAVFLWRMVHIRPSTIKQLRKKTIVIGYNNDETYSHRHPWWLFRLLKKSIPYYDHFFVYRNSDKMLIETQGVASSVFMPTIDPSRTFPIENMEKQYDVAFVGHYEDDGRDQAIARLLEMGFKVRLNGQKWKQSVYYPTIKKYLGEIEPAYDNYNEALNSAKVALVFLSRLNNDTYTRRTFEIPSTKTVMLAEYTEDQAAIFEPDEAALYFRDYDELVSRLQSILSDNALRERVANAGYVRVMNGDFFISSRVEMICDVVRSIIAQKKRPCVLFKNE